MTLAKLTAVAALALALGACQSVFAPNYRAPLEVKREAWEHVKPGCSERDCPLVNIDTVSFPALPKLDGIVESRLLQLTEDNERSTAAPSLKAYEQQYLATAKQRNSSYLQAKVREQHDGLVIVELSSYLDSGGAHGMPGRAFINYSRQQDKVLTLQDMLLPGQEETFWKTVADERRNGQGPGVHQDLAVPQVAAHRPDLRRLDREVRGLRHRPVLHGPRRAEDPLPAPERRAQARAVPRPRLTLSSAYSPPASSKAGSVAPTSGAQWAMAW